MKRRLATLLVLAGSLAAAAAPSPGERLQDYEQQVKRVAQAPRALPASHPLARRLDAELADCQSLVSRVRRLVKAGDAAEADARLRTLQIASHRLGLLELRTRIVKETLDRRLPEPRYGLIATMQVRRYPSNVVPDCPGGTQVRLLAAKGEVVDFQLILVPFDGGVSSPGYPSPYKLVEFDPLVREDSQARIEPAQCRLYLEDELKTDAQKADYLAGGYPDVAAPWHEFVGDATRADLIQAYRVTIAVPPDLAAGRYRGRLRFWPFNYETPTAVDIVLQVGAMALPPADRWHTDVRGGFQTAQVVKWYATVLALIAQKTPESFAPLVPTHNAVCREFHLAAVQDQVLSPEANYLTASEPGPLSLDTTPARLRQIIWRAWAEGKKGVLAPTLYAWKDQWRTADTRGRANCYTVADPARIGDLTYGDFACYQYGYRPSLRLLDLRDGMQDVEYFRLLEDMLRQTVTMPATKAQAVAVLARARKVAMGTDGADVTGEMNKIREAAWTLLEVGGRK